MDCEADGKTNMKDKNEGERFRKDEENAMGNFKLLGVQEQKTTLKTDLTPLTESTTHTWGQKHLSPSKTFTLFVFD